ncbi:MAG: hypothetical protein IT285_12105 [Bdellovibrionales bacterium]|nr:hypothetical protein [Bdellovibrionales bacterium]
MAKSATLFLGWLLAHVALRYLCEAFWLDRPEEFLPAFLFLALAGAWWMVPGLREGRAIPACAAALKLVLLLGLEFPDFANHSFLETLLLAMAATAPGRADLPRAAVGAASAVMIWAAVTKVAHGAFLSGAFLHWYAMRGGPLAALLTWLGEPVAPTEGPWFPAGSAPALLAGFTVGFELALGLGLLAARGVWRRALAPAGMLFFLGVEVVAEEWWFGLLMCARLAFCGLWERRWTLHAFLGADLVLLLYEISFRFGGGA